MCDKIGGLLYEICRNLITIPTNVIINCAKRMARDISARGVKRNSRAERELGSRETLRVAIGRFHKKKHRCRGAICATCLAGGRRKESGNGITILSSGWKEGRKEEGGGRGGGKGRRNTKEPRPTEEAILHFEDSTLLYSIPRRTGSTRRSSFAEMPFQTSVARSLLPRNKAFA